MGNFFCRIQIFLLSGMKKAEHKSIDGPPLASGPRRTFSIALAAVVPRFLPGLRIKFHNMFNRSVRADKMLLHRICMHHSNLTEPWILCFFRCPVEQRNIKHTINDCPTSCIPIPSIIPCTDKTPNRIIPARHQIRRMQSRLSGAGIPCQSVIRNGCRLKHKPYVMVQSIKHVKALL